MTIEAAKTITIDGKEYPVTGFSPAVQQLVAIHTQWRNDQQKARLEVAKVEAALRSLDIELSAAVQADLKPAPAPVEPAAPAAPVAVPTGDAPVAQ